MSFSKKPVKFLATPVFFRILTGFFFGLFFFFHTRPALAWGPAVHYQLGIKFIELCLGGVLLGKILRNNKDYFLYGNVIADLIAGKSKIDYTDSSHNWKIIAKMAENSSSQAQEVFTLGFKLHLAADTVAHNEFVPDNLSRTKLPPRAEHAYWEFKAENQIPSEARKDLKRMTDCDLNEVEKLLEDTIPTTVFPFAVNWKLIKSLLGLSAHPNWHKITEKWQELSRHDFKQDDFNPYFEESLRRMQWCCGSREQKKQIYRLDPTGTYNELPKTHQATGSLLDNDLSELLTYNF